jgi:hypothetical protein
MRFKIAFKITGMTIWRTNLKTGQDTPASWSSRNKPIEIILSGVMWVGMAEETFGFHYGSRGGVDLLPRYPFASRGRSLASAPALN